jgi:hypothetical protein
MTVSATLVTKNDEVRRLVRDFAHGLGCRIGNEALSSAPSIRVDMDDDGHSLLELLTHVALAATQAGVDVAEPVCHVTYRHDSVASEVTLTLRIADFRIDRAARARV